MHKYARSTHKYLREIDHPVGADGQADTCKPEVAFDVASMAGAVEPAIDDLTGAHWAGGNIFGRYMKMPKSRADLVYPLVEAVMPEWGFAAEHVAAVL
jgi:hypothetical protein